MILFFRKIRWILQGKQQVHYSGFNCGCCGKWWNISFKIPEYRSAGEWWDTWGLCPILEVCNEELLPEEVRAIDNLWNGEKYFCSTDIHNKTTYGYGDCDHGVFEFPLRKDWIDKQIYIELLENKRR